jgi:hypothetical protein
MNYFKEMLELQDSFNQKLDTNWRERDWDWINALMIESSEQNDSLRWKWWKKEENDFENFKVEVIDNWHFLMSLMMQKYDKTFLARQFNRIWNHILDDLEEINLQESTQEFLYYVLSSKFNDEVREDINHVYAIKTLFLIMQDNKIGITKPVELFSEYLVKNVLNQFRKNNGYKDGTYIKIWNNEEDNIVAYRLVQKIRTKDVFNELYSLLEKEYQSIKK